MIYDYELAIMIYMDILLSNVMKRVTLYRGTLYTSFTVPNRSVRGGGGGFKGHE